MIKHLLLSLMALVPALMSAQTSARDTAETYGTERDMPVFYQRLKARLTWPWAWHNKQHTMSFDTWRTEARQQVMATMQMAPPAPADHSFTVTDMEHRDGYDAHRIVYHVNAWEATTAYLLTPCHRTKADPDGKHPLSIHATGKHPALLLLHDHGAHFSIGKEKMVRPFACDSTVLADAQDWVARCYDGRYVGDDLARAGFVVLATDALFWGERGRKEGVRYDSQQALASNMLQMGASWGAWIAWDDVRSAEFLAAQDFVDASRVGCLGFSMGAHRSWMTAALTDAITASASICWINDTEHLMTLTNNQNKGGSAYSMLIPGLRNIMDYPHVASLACPKPTLFFNGTRDKLFPVPGVERAYDVMRMVWESQGASDRLILRLWDEKHFFNQAMQREVEEFFKMKNDKAPSDSPDGGGKAGAVK